ncbi:MAG: hypothetical protein ABIJ09_03060 [Pseudomonadota bacterium]
MPDQPRTYDVNVNPPPGTPTGVWDPAWNDAVVASELALQAYGRVRHLPFDGCTLLPASEMPRLAKKHTEQRSFKLDRVVDLPAVGVRFRGGSYGEIFRRYSFGPRPAANFHAQAVFFGADSEGRFFVDARVGLVGGSIKDEAALAIAFVGTAGVLGGVAWHGQVQSEHDNHLLILGRDETLRAAFDQLTEVQVEFFARCAGA